MSALESDSSVTEYIALVNSTILTSTCFFMRRSRRATSDGAVLDDFVKTWASQKKLKGVLVCHMGQPVGNPLVDELR